MVFSTIIIQLIHTKIFLRISHNSSDFQKKLKTDLMSIIILCKVNAFSKGKESFESILILA